MTNDLERSEVTLSIAGLPKWPHMKTTGMPISSESALEIIRRTDTFLNDGCGGNDHKWDVSTSRRLRMPHGTRDSYDKPYVASEWNERHARADHWRKTWGIVRTAYVTNDWMSSCFIFGPRGWCHPDGSIGYSHNVGKWPGVDDVKDDWANIAKEFPFLDIGVTLMDRESCEEGAIPVVSIQIRNGLVKLVDPLFHDVHHGHPEIQSRDTMALVGLEGGRDWSNYSHEHGLSESVIADWERLASNLFPEFNND